MSPRWLTGMVEVHTSTRGCAAPSISNAKSTHYSPSHYAGRAAVAPAAVDGTLCVDVRRPTVRTVAPDCCGHPISGWRARRSNSASYSIMERLGLSHLFEDQIQGAGSPLYLAVGAICLSLLFVSFYVYLSAPKRLGDGRRRRESELLATTVGAFSFLGFASCAFSWQGVPFLSKRVWVIFTLFGLLASAPCTLLYLRIRQRKREAGEAIQRRQRYMPRPKSGVRKRRRRRT